MEPVSDIIGHCFVVGDTRHQLRASMSAGWRGSAGQVCRNFRQLSPHRTTGFFFHSCPPTGQLDFFSQLSPHRTTGFFFTVVPPQDHWIFFTVVGLDDNLDIFFVGRIPTLARARQGFYAGQVARPGGARSAKLTVPRVLAICTICAIWLSQGKPPLSLEGVSQMDSILPERLLALVRPAFDLVLRRIQSLKRCVQA